MAAGPVIVTLLIDPVATVQLDCVVIVPVASIVGKLFTVIVPLADVDAEHWVVLSVTNTEYVSCEETDTVLEVAPTMSPELLPHWYV